MLCSCSEQIWNASSGGGLNNLVLVFVSHWQSTTIRRRQSLTLEHSSYSDRMMWQTQGTGETEKGRIHLACLLSSLTAFKSYLNSGQSQDLNQLLSLLMVGATNWTSAGFNFVRNASNVNCYGCSAFELQNKYIGIFNFWYVRPAKPSQVINVSPLAFSLCICPMCPPLAKNSEDPWSKSMSIFFIGCYFSCRAYSFAFSPSICSFCPLSLSLY